MISVTFYSCRPAEEDQYYLTCTLTLTEFDSIANQLLEQAQAQQQAEPASVSTDIIQYNQDIIICQVFYRIFSNLILHWAFRSWRVLSSF